MISSLSVFFPAFNEEKNIEETVLKAVKVLKKIKLKEWEILIINDGSSDKTPSIADRLAAEIEQVRAIHQPNGGYGMALRGGFKNAKMDWVVYTDSDGQFDFSEVIKFIDKAEQGMDIIYGFRIERQDHLIRKLNAAGWKLALFLFFGITVKDVDCGFKMVSKKLLRSIPPLLSTRGGMINAELYIQAKRYKFKYAQVPVHHYPRRAGKPTGANFKVILQSFIDLFQLRLTVQ